MILIEANRIRSPNQRPGVLPPLPPPVTVRPGDHPPPVISVPFTDPFIMPPMPTTELPK
jgi:hypothetical protein